VEIGSTEEFGREDSWQERWMQQDEPVQQDEPTQQEELVP
jgi:hypothetical protein